MKTKEARDASGDFATLPLKFWVAMTLFVVAVFLAGAVCAWATSAGLSVMTISVI